MSVAFDDHGESVPGRGTTSSDVVAAAAVFVASGPYVSSRSSVARSPAEQWPGDFDEVMERRRDAGDAVRRTGGGEALVQLGQAEIRQRGPAGQREDFGHRFGDARKAGLYAVTRGLRDAAKR